MQIIRTGERLYPLLNEAFPVALAARTPHSRSLAAIEHAKLDSCAVRYLTHLTSKRIYLPDYLSLGYASYGRIATHLANRIHIHRDQQRPATQTCSCVGSFATGMSGSYYDDVVFKFAFLHAFLWAWF
jgi:hypothetical protein